MTTRPSTTSPTTMRIAFLVAAVAIAACSTQELSNTGHVMQKQQCQPLKDLDERKRCEARADQAKAEAEGKKK